MGSVYSFALPAEPRSWLGRGECYFAWTLHSCTVQTSFLACVTDAPTYSRWLKVATKQSCICHFSFFLSSVSLSLFLSFSLSSFSLYEQSRADLVGKGL